MKRTISLLTAIIMVLSLITIPVTAETTPAIKDAASLDEALNVEGGALHFEPYGDHTFVVEENHAKSNNQSVGNSNATVLVQGINTAEPSVMRLKYKVSSEQGWDFFYIYIDGQSVFSDSGDKSADWSDAAVVIPAGTSEVKLVYHKDGSGNKFEDTVWIDDVSIGEYVSVTGVAFEQESITLDIGSTEQLVWNILPEDAATRDVEFTSSDTSVATVAATGLVTAVNEGTATITVTTAEGGFTDTVEVHVNPAIHVESVIVTPSEITIPVLDSYYFQLQAEVLPENASFRTITWSSSDPSILDVSSIGMLKGLAPGTAEAIATTPEGIAGRCTVTVVAQQDYPGVLSLDFTNISSLPFAQTDIALGNGDGQLILYSRSATATPQLGYAIGYSFTAAPGQQVCFRTDWRTDEHDENDRFDTCMILYDGEGNFITYNDDDTANRPYSNITYTFTEGGTYYVVVVPYYKDRAGIFRFYADVVAPEPTPGPTEPIVTPTPVPTPADAVFTYDDATVEPGETFSVTVALNNYNNDCCLLDMDILYDPALLTYVSHTGGSMYQHAYSANIHLEQEGTISANFYGGDDEWSGEDLPIYVYGDCTIVTITFTVNENAPSGNTALSFDINWFEDVDEVPLDYTIEAGTIAIESSTTPTPAPTTPAPIGGLDDALNVDGGTLHFEPVGDYTFIVEETWAKSNNQNVNSSEAVISIENYDFSNGAVLCFQYKISSESNYDKLQVVANSTPIFQDSGNHTDAWIECRVVIPAGTQSVRLIYHKDVSNSEGNDTAWIDNVRIGELLPVTGVEFTEEAVSMPLGRTYQLTWNILPENADITSVTFTVDNSEIATVSASGLITSHASGDAVITITTDDGGFTDTIAVHVEEFVDVEQVIVSPATITIPVTSTACETLQAVILPENATNTTVTWESSDPEICTVAGGSICGIVPGTATITATSENGIFGTCVVTVVAPEDFTGILDIDFTDITELPYFNGEVGVGIGYGTPVMYQRNQQSALTYSYVTGFSYTANAGETVCFRTNWYNGESTPEHRIDTYITVFNSAGEVITYNDDDSEYNNSPFSRIQITFDLPGTYYFVVAPYNYQNSVSRGLIQVIAESMNPGLTLGDVDGDGVIGMNDALLTARQIMGLITLTSEQIAAADMNTDSFLNFDDVILIMRQSMSLRQY